MRVFGEPAPESVDTIWPPLAAVGVLAITPADGTRAGLTASALALSPTFRQLAIQLAQSGTQLALEGAGAALVALSPTLAASRVVAGYVVSLATRSLQSVGSAVASAAVGVAGFVQREAAS